MKKLVVLLTVILLISACDKEEQKTQETKYPVSIKAGQTTGIGIKYTDIIPDDTTLGYYPYPFDQYKYLDINGDSINDFELLLKRSDPGIMGMITAVLEIVPLGMNAVCTSATNPTWADSLKYNDPIDANTRWSDSTALLYDFLYLDDYPYGTTFIKGYWFNTDAIYIGVKITKDDKQYFGWIDMKRNVIRQFAVTVPYLE
jgi:hypothetical protein